MSYLDSENPRRGALSRLGRAMRHFPGRAGWVAGLVAVGLLASTSLARVEPGNVGIRVNNIAGGVSPDSLGVGWYLAPPGTHIYEYPVFTRTYTWTANPTEQSPIDESFTFQDKNGLSLSADVAVSYHVDPARAAILFQRYRTDMDQIIAGPLRNAIRNAIVERAAQLGVEQIYGDHKAELIQTAQKRVEAFFAPVGLQVEQVYWAGNIVVPRQVLEQINAKIANEQAALAAQANVATAKADAEARVAKAQGDAKAIQVEAEAIRTNPEIVKLRAVEKWDGKLPTYSGSGPVPFLGVQ
ncbi:SPFH domain-containing protein [Novosphingobium album (ex Hu et al. 2023)]|uniref:SPFH domain-containing protein n=1 Tax=Novosphingobium album (ex Hu et al. 2023) TaxID=2930093 RepID=A0ABT0B4B6_9SPHN|nr:SPFH domain-containing protein [Novosphingobium album (ex Hu et al. 2023)]MCJ2179833.1 SPFH domain-containing protein [Novosphingobium album (ex Hu et al. 2023)]